MIIHQRNYCIIPIFLFILLAVITSQVLAGIPKTSIQSLTLAEALRQTKQRNIEVLIANERVAQSLARIDQTVSNGYPQFSANVSERRQTKDLSSAGISLPNMPSLVGPFNSFDARIRLTQSIFDVSLLERWRAAREAGQLSEAQRLKVLNDALALTATTFINAFRAQEIVDLSGKVLQRDLMKLRLIRERQGTGIASGLEYKQAQAQYVRSLNRWRMSIVDFDQKRNDLAVILDNADITKIHLEAFSTGLSTNSSKDLAQHPEIKLAKKKLELSKANHAAEKSEYLPKISGFGDYGLSGLSPTEGSETYTLGVQASVPIWEGGMRKARIKESESQVREDQLLLENADHKLKAKIKSAQEILAQVKILLDEKKANINVYKELWRQASIQFESGSGSEFDLVDARTRLAMVRDEEDEARATYILAEINLAHAQGIMDKLIDHLKEK